jgi:chromosome segregation ATPase
MEGPVKGKQAFVYCAIVLSSSAWLIGCKDDSAAVSALEELTGQLSDQVSELNGELTSVSEQLQTCLKDLAETKGEAVVISTTDPTEEAPTLEGEASLDSLEALKTKLNDTVARQKGALSDLKTKVEGCQKDLAAAKEEAEAAAAEAEAAAAAEAEAEAAAAEAARKKAATRKKRPTKESTMVKQREAEGRPTTGTGSRYEKR